MNLDRWAVGLGALLLVLWGLVVCAHQGRADTLRAHSPVGNGNGPAVTLTFDVDGQPLPATGHTLQSDGSAIYTADAGQPSLPYTVGATLCRGEECVAAIPMVVDFRPEPPPPAPLQAPLIKSAARLDPETIEARVKDYDTNTLGTYPYVVIERLPELDGEWIEADSWLAPSQAGIPANERLWLLDAADPGCTGVRARVLRDGGQESPWSAPVTVGVCGQLPPPGCEWDLDGDGVVGGTDVLAWMAGWVAGTYQGRDWLAISAAFGTVCR